MKLDMKSRAFSGVCSALSLGNAAVSYLALLSHRSGIDALVTLNTAGT